MSLMRGRMQTVALRKRREVLRDDQGGYEPAHRVIQAGIQPLSGMVVSRMYGERMNRMKLLLAFPEAEIAEGMGVCVDAAPEAHPDYKVVYTARWAKHTAAHLQWIPEGERGADE